jgi:MATE family multidrug resistance protein
MLVRNLALQFTLAFVTLKGAQYGTQSAAINAVLMQFFALIALGLDGIANAVEALVGEVKGQGEALSTAKTKEQATLLQDAEINNKKGNVAAINDLKDLQTSARAGLVEQVLLGIIWSSLTALLYMLIFWLFGVSILALLTDQQVLINATKDYYWVILLLPIVAHWCFLFDGVYVGLTQGKTMRNNMLISTFCVFLPSYFILSEFGNQALWIAMFAFLAARGIGLGSHFVWILLPAHKH